MSKWQVNLYAVTESEIGRIEKPINELGEAEIKNAAITQNKKALLAAGYSPVIKKTKLKAAR